MYSLLVFLNSNKTDRRSSKVSLRFHLACCFPQWWILFQVGTYTELLQNEGAFSEFLKTFAAEQNAEEEGLLYLLTVLCTIFVLYLSHCITVCTNAFMVETPLHNFIHLLKFYLSSSFVFSVLETNRVGWMSLEL